MPGALSNMLIKKNVVKLVTYQGRIEVSWFNTKNKPFSEYTDSQICMYHRLSKLCAYDV